MSEARFLAAADAVLDAGVRPVAGLEELSGDAGVLVGGELVAPAVDLFEQGQLRARVGFLPAADDAQIGRPVLQLVTVGCSRSSAVSSTTAALSRPRGDLRRPSTWSQRGRDTADGGAFAGTQVQPME